MRKKSCLSIVLSAAVVLTMLPTMAFVGAGTVDTPSASGGEAPLLTTSIYDLNADGAKDSVYEISSADQLLWFADRVNNGYGETNAVLTADIDLTGKTFTPIGVSGSEFKGFFDGRGYTVENMVFTTVQNGYDGNLTYNNQGLFGVVRGGATVRNLTVKGEIVLAAAGQKHVGGVVGHAYEGARISNVISYVNINDSTNTYDSVERIGGIAGRIGNSDDNTSATIERCTYYGTIHMHKADQVGGIAGRSEKDSVVKSCSNYGTIGWNYRIGHIGGVVGSAQTGTAVSDSANYGTVEAAHHDCVGGVVGYANEYVSITDCVNAGAVSAQKSGTTNVFVGGILGYVNNRNFEGVTNCFNFGTVSAVDGDTYCGAIVGWVNSATQPSTISGNYWWPSSCAAAYGTGGKQPAAPTDAITVTSSTTILNDAWYVVTGEVAITGQMESRAPGAGARLFLADNAKLTVSNCVTVGGSNVLSVYAQSAPVLTAEGELDEENNKTGALITKTESNASQRAAIGGYSGSHGKITINGGVINATGSSVAPGIGGKDADSLIINGGFVKATGSSGAPGIGRHKGLSGGVTINGGTVMASARGYAAAIGGGQDAGCGTIVINGGTVKATSGNTTTMTENSYGAAIGCGANYSENTDYSGSSITINAGTVIATAYSYGAVIGGGWKGSGCAVTINGGKVTATCVGNGGIESQAAAIGGSSGGDCGTVIINGGTVTAQGGRKCAGIGCASVSGGDITINAGTIFATGGYQGAGIGGGSSRHADTITINGGIVNATGNGASGIGAGDNVSGGLITINGGIVNATGNDGNGIGTDVYTGTTDTPTTINITGGTINAVSTAQYLQGIRVEENGVFTVSGFDKITVSAPRQALEVAPDFADGLHVRAWSGSSVDALQPIPFSKVSTVCTTAPAVRFELCTNHTENQLFACKDSSLHTVYCYWDGTSYEEPHSFNEEGVCVCYSTPGSYLDYDAASGQFELKARLDATSVTSSDRRWRAGWYLVEGDVVIGTSAAKVRLEVLGDVHLILADNSSLIVNGAIDVSDDDADPGNGSANRLTIYGQTHPVANEQGALDVSRTTTGHLTVNGQDSYCAGIGSYTNAKSCGVITINGGVIDSTGYYAGIGGAGFGDCGTITINGGAVTAQGGKHCAGIGSGNYNSSVTPVGGTVTINGGIVKAQGGERASGIGSGYFGSASSKGVYNGGTVTITGGTVTATGGKQGAGIGNGEGTSCEVTINGGTVTANGGDYGAGIGGGEESGATKITILNGDITAKGGDSGAGIGNGYYSGDLTVIVKGGTIEATGGLYGAGIGNGLTSSKLDVTIEGGTVTAQGGQYAAGIGTYHRSTDALEARITISGGEVNATGGNEGAGIGNGTQGADGIVKITGGTVTAQGGQRGAGIGSGNGVSNTNPGSIAISGGTVHAIGGSYAAAIGCGYNASSSSRYGDIDITGGSILAQGVVGIGVGHSYEGSFGNITISDADIQIESQFASIGSVSTSGTFGTVTVNSGTITAKSTDDDVFGGPTDLGAFVINGGIISAYSRISYRGAFEKTPILSEAETWKVYTGTSLDNLSLVETPAESTYTGSQALLLMSESTEMIRVNVSWTSMEFTYKDSTWDAAAHDYTTPGWSTEGGTISVKNQSNRAMEAEFSFTSGMDGITGSFTNSKLTLAFGQSGNTSIALSGQPNGALNKQPLGTVTIKLSVTEAPVIT